MPQLSVSNIITSVCSCIAFSTFLRVWTVRYVTCINNRLQVVNTPSMLVTSRSITRMSMICCGRKRWCVKTSKSMKIRRARNSLWRDSHSKRWYQWRKCVPSWTTVNVIVISPPPSSTTAVLVHMHSSLLTYRNSRVIGLYVHREWHSSIWQAVNESIHRAKCSGRNARRSTRVSFAWHAFFTWRVWSTLATYPTEIQYLPR